MKKALRKLVAPVCFLLCALLLAGLADAVLSQKSSTMAAFYAEPKNTVDVLFVGGSHSAAAFDPIQLWDEHGIPSYNLFSWGQPAWTSYHYTVEALKTQRPQVVVLEAYGLLYGNSYLSNENFNNTSDDYSLLIRPSLNRLQLALAMSAHQTDHRSVFSYASLSTYHSRWQVFEPSFVSFFFEDHYSTGKGFGPNYTTEAFPPNVRPNTVPAAGLYPGCEEYLYKMMALAKAEGFELVVAAAPYVMEVDGEWAVYDQIAAICAENDVAFLDYNGAAGAEAGLDFSTDLAEHAHVNLYGAEKISRHIGQVLAQNPALPNRQDDEGLAHWRTAAAAEGRDRERMRLMVSPTPASYLERLGEGEFVAFIVSRGPLDALPAELSEKLTAMGLPAGATDSQALLAVVENGHITQARQGAELEFATTVAGRSVLLTTSGAVASLLLDGAEQARGHDGLLLLVLHRDGTFIQSVAFNAAAGYAVTTD